MTNVPWEERKKSYEDEAERIQIGFSHFHDGDDNYQADDSVEIADEAMHSYRAPNRREVERLVAKVRKDQLPRSLKLDELALGASKTGLITPNSLLAYAVPKNATAERGGLTH